MFGRSRKTGASTDALDTKRRLEGIVASAMDGIITVNDLQIVILFNPAAERMFSLPAEQALGEHISRFIPERFRSVHAEHIHLFAKTGVTNRQMGSLGAISGMRSDGTEFPIEASISQVEVGGERLATVILRDITERKAAEDALLESRRRMEGIVESAMDALITVDEQQRVMLFNPAAEFMFGVKASEAIGSPIETFIPVRFRAGHAEHIRHFRDAGMTNRRMGALGAISGMRSNGEEFPIEASISQLDIGGVKIATVILRDITERKANEEARQLLAREVDHRAKNALAVVQALVNLTKAPTKEAFVAAVCGRVAALGRAHSLLAQNRWEGASLAQVVADETSPYHRPGQLRMQGPNIVLGPHAVQPVSLLLHELATNAVKYGALSVEGGDVQIGWRILPTGDLELSWIEAGGPEISAPASQGFGSTLVAEVSRRQLGGVLDIRWPKEGLQLSVTLPSAVYRRGAGMDHSVTDQAKAPLPIGAVRGCILVVEDETLIGMELCNSLMSMGWQVVGPAATIEEATRLVTETPHLHAAILDVNLGGTPVYPLAELLQAQHVPVVFCTGYEKLDHQDRFRSCPVIRKPIDVGLLDIELRRAQPVAA
ncbi:PAS domain S-box protein [Phenylobacterium sp.]|uniref:PAS domain S-box protein n=1 Tax=Phenylobacterium sp. TaxID=1871053 RepID=UPI00273674A8|nr:PAS domain S-box protein [Phenylobacterium sp.]MDP3854910.1 PAS domain S-box protein [Phenylobacterium sp.]